MGFSDKNVLIVGLGLIGASYARAIRKYIHPNKIWGVDINREVIDLVKKEDIVDDAFVNCNNILKSADIVIVSLYPQDTIDFIVNNMENFKQGAIITDTCGLKSSLVGKINKVIRKDIDFIGTHPMAGKEKGGFVNSSSELFVNSNYIITPTLNNKEENINIINDMALKMGCRNIIKVSPKEHDEAIAITSHLPHILAVALMNTGNSLKDIKYLVGGSFKDTTRVATINGELWSQLFMANKENLVKVIDEFQKNIECIKSAIIEEDKEKLNEAFKKSCDGRREIQL
jgi:prephenate dehydrogenase